MTETVHYNGFTPEQIMDWLETGGTWSQAAAWYISDLRRELARFYDAEVLRLSASKADAERAVGDEVRGMMRDFETEISDLERWKAEAIEVLASWDEVADLIPVKLGDSKAAAVKAWVLRTSAEVEELTESLANVRGDLNYAISDRRWNRGGKP